MGSAQRIPIAGRLGLYGMLAIVPRAAAPRPAPAAVRWAAAPIPAPPPRTPAEVALRQAWRYRTRAKIAVADSGQGRRGPTACSGRHGFNRPRFAAAVPICYPVS
jgi:hypothetical protein